MARKRSTSSSLKLAGDIAKLELARLLEISKKEPLSFEQLKSFELLAKVAISKSEASAKRQKETLSQMSSLTDEQLANIIKEAVSK